jgi:RNA polymerase sigma factor (sigma-70 family)
MPKLRRPRPPLDAATRAFCEEQTVALLPLIQRIAARSKLRLPIEDLVQEGATAVFEALPRWDASRGAKLETWLAPRIFGAMRDYARKFRFLKGGQRSRQESIESLDRAQYFTDTGNRVSLHDELPARKGIPRGDWQRLLRGFSKRERIILIGYFVLDRTMKQIAADLDVGESRVSQQMAALLDRFRRLEISEHRVSEALL